jgi:transposase InsO family protein
VIGSLTRIFDRFGLVEEIVTDNGLPFVSKEFEDFLAADSIKHGKSALYSPQANAAVERLNRVIKEGIKAAMAFHDRTAGLCQVVVAHGMTKHTTTGVNPASLMLAFLVRTLLSVLTQSCQSIELTSTTLMRQTADNGETTRSSDKSSAYIN